MWSVDGKVEREGKQVQINRAHKFTSLLGSPRGNNMSGHSPKIQPNPYSTVILRGNGTI